MSMVFPFHQTATVLISLSTCADALTMIWQVSATLRPTYKGPLTTTDGSTSGIGEQRMYGLLLYNCDLHIYKAIMIAFGILQTDEHRDSARCI